jgi:hypothetical protein
LLGHVLCDDELLAEEEWLFVLSEQVKDGLLGNLELFRIKFKFHKFL